MDKINLHKAAKLTAPNPVTMVCTRKEDGATNLATVSWWTYLSYHPNLIAFAMAKESYSGERVRQSKEVIVTVPGAALAQAAMGCGSYSGREMDKAAQYDIALMPVEGSGIQIPVHSRLAMVSACRSIMRRATITCTSARWTRSTATLRSRPCSPGMVIPSCARWSNRAGRPVSPR